MEEAGAEVTVVKDGQQAVELFEKLPAATLDAILMDIMMPVMDGLSATRAVSYTHLEPTRLEGIEKPLFWPCIYP